LGSQTRFTRSRSRSTWDSRTSANMTRRKLYPARIQEGYDELQMSSSSVGLRGQNFRQ
jgi:hypothetical protein